MARACCIALLAVLAALHACSTPSDRVPGTMEGHQALSVYKCSGYMVYLAEY